jgi:SAM-dependent methyltransferase
MERIRKPFQGVLNIVRFNWHLYIFSLCIILLILSLVYFIPKKYDALLFIACSLIMTTTIISLLVSFYIYDLSDLYTFNWLNKSHINPAKIININAGFDETSALLKEKYPNENLQVFDFYDAERHTEVSIKRARAAYPNTINITTSAIPLSNDTIDIIFLILAAHEIRNDVERGAFFNELKRIMAPAGKIIVTEHLRDLPNFLAYTIGFFHFHSRSTWQKTFAQAGIIINEEIKITPFITTFILQKNGTTT